MSENINDRITAATDCQPFVVKLTDGLCLVVAVNVGGGIEALHSNPISHAAAASMADELVEPSPSGDFDAIAEHHELRARILAVIGNADSALDGQTDPCGRGPAEWVADMLASARPWERCHRPPVGLDPDAPF